MNIQTIDWNEADLTTSDYDTGDYEHCGDCGEWVVPESEIVTDEITQTLKKVYSCPCGGVFEEEI